MTEPQAASTRAPMVNAAVQMEPHKSRFPVFIPQSMMGSMLAIIALTAILPVMSVGWLGYNSTYNASVEDMLHDVEMVAEIKHIQLVHTLIPFLHP